MGNKFEVELVPLNDFSDGETFVSIFPDGWGREIERVRVSAGQDRFAEATFARWARGVPLAPVPFPTNDEGEELCHGTILGTSKIDGVTHPDREQFTERPLHMQSAMAMRLWLKVRNATAGKSLGYAKRETYFGECIHVVVVAPITNPLCVFVLHTLIICFCLTCRQKHWRASHGNDRHHHRNAGGSRTTTSKHPSRHGALGSHRPSAVRLRVR